MSKERILVVDDDPTILKYVSSDLETHGYEVFVAQDGAEALHVFEKELPDIMLLDIKIPKINGFEVCRRIREWSQMPIIMLTGLGGEKDKIEAFNLGVDDYLAKPFGPKELIARVRSLLRRSNTKL